MDLDCLHYCLVGTGDFCETHPEQLAMKKAIEEFVVELEKACEKLAKEINSGK